MEGSFGDYFPDSCKRLRVLPVVSLLADGKCFDTKHHTKILLFGVEDADVTMYYTYSSLI